MGWLSKLNPFRKGGPLDKITRGFDKATGGIAGKVWKSAEKGIEKIPGVGSVYTTAKGIGSVVNNILSDPAAESSNELANVGNALVKVSGQLPGRKISAVGGNVAPGVDSFQSVKKGSTNNGNVGGILGLAAAAYFVLND